MIIIVIIIIIIIVSFLAYNSNNWLGVKCYSHLSQYAADCCTIMCSLIKRVEWHIHICILWYQQCCQPLWVVVHGWLVAFRMCLQKGSQIWTILYSSHQFTTWPSHHGIGTHFMCIMLIVFSIKIYPFVRSFVRSFIRKVVFIEFNHSLTLLLCMSFHNSVSYLLCFKHTYIAIPN